MIYILDAINGIFVKPDIIAPDKKEFLFKKNGWKFNWKQLSIDGTIYILRALNSPYKIEGVLCLKIEHEMMIMDALELVFHNIGRTTKDMIMLPCLIAFACRENLKIP